MSRLIDADALLKFVEDRYEITWESDTYEGGIKDACSDIIEKIDNMPTIEPEPHWIPCSERMPEDGQLIYASFQYFQCCIIAEYSSYIRDAIDAWVPLPEPYKGGQGEDNRR